MISKVLSRVELQAGIPLGSSEDRVTTVHHRLDF